MNAWLIIIVIGAGSLLFRLSMVALADWVTVPAPAARASELVAPAAFAALATTAVATMVVASAGGGAPLAAVPPLAAAAVAVVAVQRTGSPHAAVLAGMPALWLLTAALG